MTFTIIRWKHALAVCVCTAMATVSEEHAVLVLAADGTSSAVVEAVGAVMRAALHRAGLRAVEASVPQECRPHPSRPPECLNATLRALFQETAHVAVVSLGAYVPSAMQLRDMGIQEMGDAVPPQRLACFATAGPARSLLDLTHADIAHLYNRADLADRTLKYVCGGSVGCAKENMSTIICEPSPGTATLLVDDDEDTEILARVVCQWKLKAHVAKIRPRQPGTPIKLVSSQPSIYCTQDPDAWRMDTFYSLIQPLGPPPCTTKECPFEYRRLVIMVNARALAHSATAYRVTGRVSLDANGLRDLLQHVRKAGLETGTRHFLETRPKWSRPPAEARVAVFVPTDTHRELHSPTALRAAVEIAELDSNSKKHPVRFKVELVAGGCTATTAFKYLMDALGSEFGALSAVAGPACGAAFADVARRTPSLWLPMIAYTAQAPPANGAGLTLLAGGDGREETDAWAAMFIELKWHRVAVLSELATRSMLDPTRLQVDILVHVELAADGDELYSHLITQWAERAAERNARVMLVSAEDARIVRHALCAGARAGLSSGEGVVWLLPGWLPAEWLHGPAPCNQLDDLAEGHLAFVPEWLAQWDASNDTRPWDARWRAACRRHTITTADECLRPPGVAALLYDTLQLWAVAIRRLLAARPADLDDLHRHSVVRKLMAEAISTPANDVGLTGPFNWISAGEAHARSSPLVLVQAVGARWRHVGRWSEKRLRLDMDKLVWRTADGRVPDDGTERCSLQPLADFFGCECRIAFAAVVGVTLVLAVIALAGGAWHCKLRAEREYRTRLAELRAHTMGLKASGSGSGLDRWELPRERIVINRKLGTGAFGTVYGGHALLEENRGWTAVAVKTLKVGATTEEKLDFLSEAETMKRFDHKNVVRLLGVITNSEPVCTVMELMLFGDLKTFLLARRHLADCEEVSATRLTSLALDAARALSYLTQLRYVHRDVAARNCLVSSNRVLKLADFGMTRLVFEHDYYRFSRKGLLPVRWMAPESLALGVFSPASDVWSYGVLLYEMVTFGALPYQGLGNSEVLARVKAGHTLNLPVGIKPQLEGLMKSCWVREARSRPSAAQIVAFLSEWPRLVTPCPDMPPVTLGVDGALCETRWSSPASARTESTYMSEEGQPARDTDAFLP